MLRPFVLSLVVVAACVPGRGALFGPVDREAQHRLGVGVAWSDSQDPRVPAAVRDLLSRPLDLDAAVRIGLANSRRLQARFDELGIAAADVADATVLAPAEVDFDVKLASGGGGEVEVNAVQDVLGLLQLPQRRGAANAALAAVRARAVAATVELARQVEVAFLDVVAAEQQLELRQTALDAASASAELATRMHAAGNTSDLALAREQDQREEAQVDRDQAQLAVDTAREALNGVLGLVGDDTHWTTAARLPDLPEAAPALDGLETDAAAASLELAAIGDDADAAAGRLRVARVRAFLPELGVGAAAARRDGGDWEAGPALRIGLPIFDQQQGPRARAHAEVSRAHHLADAFAAELGAEARSVRERAEATYKTAVHLRDVVLPLRQQVLDETLKQYNAMNASTFELLSAKRDLVAAGARYVDALRDYWLAAADAKALARGGLPGDTTLEDSP
ncbi:MAG: TolC family protein [Dehalococcoidia bacterium]|nr:TolC family protein [Dehalococcoidia bacterium]